MQAVPHQAQHAAGSTRSAHPRLNTHSPRPCAGCHQVAFEHKLLAALNQQPLSFQVPAALPSRAGRPHELLSSGTEACVFEIIPGTLAKTTSPQEVGGGDVCWWGGGQGSRWTVGRLLRAPAPGPLRPGPPLAPASNALASLVLAGGAGHG